MIDNNTLNKLAELLNGIPVLHVIPDSAVDKAGVKAGDILLQVNDHATPDADAFVRARELREGGMSFKVWRNGQEIEGEAQWAD